MVETDFQAIQDKVDALNKAMGYRNRKLQDEERTLQTTFRNCLFEGNEASLAQGINYVLIFVATDTASTTFDICIFRDNDYRSIIGNPVSSHI